MENSDNHVKKETGRIVNVKCTWRDLASVIIIFFPVCFRSFSNFLSFSILLTLLVRHHSFFFIYLLPTGPIPPRPTPPAE